MDDLPQRMHEAADTLMEASRRYFATSNERTLEYQDWRPVKLRHVAEQLRHVAELFKAEDEQRTDRQALQKLVEASLSFYGVVDVGLRYNCADSIACQIEARLIAQKNNTPDKVNTLDQENL